MNNNIHNQLFQIFVALFFFVVICSSLVLLVCSFSRMMYYFVYFYVCRSFRQLPALMVVARP